MRFNRRNIRQEFRQYGDAPCPKTPADAALAGGIPRLLRFKLSQKLLRANRLLFQTLKIDARFSTRTVSISTIDFVPPPPYPTMRLAFAAIGLDDIWPLLVIILPVLRRGSDQWPHLPGRLPFEPEGTFRTSIDFHGGECGWLTSVERGRLTPWANRREIRLGGPGRRAAASQLSVLPPTGHDH
jgi:hypothetical protein